MNIICYLVSYSRVKPVEEREKTRGRGEHKHWGEAGEGWGEMREDKGEGG